MNIFEDSVFAVCIEPQPHRDGWKHSWSVVIKGLVLLEVLFIVGAGSGTRSAHSSFPGLSLRSLFCAHFLLAVGSPVVALLCSAADGPPPPNSTQEGFAFVIGKKGH